MQIKWVRNTTQIRSFADLTRQSSCFFAHSVLAALEQCCFFQSRSWRLFSTSGDSIRAHVFRLHCVYSLPSPGTHGKRIWFLSQSAPLRHISNIFLNKSPGVLQFLCPAFRSLDEGDMPVLRLMAWAVLWVISNSPTFDTTQVGTVVSQKSVRFRDDSGERRAAYTRKQA